MGTWWLWKAELAHELARSLRTILPLVCQNHLLSGFWHLPSWTIKTLREPCANLALPCSTTAFSWGPATKRKCKTCQRHSNVRLILFCLLYLFGKCPYGYNSLRMFNYVNPHDYPPPQENIGVEICRWCGGILRVAHPQWQGEGDILRRWNYTLMSIPSFENLPNQHFNKQKRNTHPGPIQESYEGHAFVVQDGCINTWMVGVDCRHSILVSNIYDLRKLGSAD